MFPPGTVGVAAVTAGPGLTNTVTAVKNAQMAESPLLLIGGAAATLLQVELVLVLMQTLCLGLHLSRFFFCKEIRYFTKCCP